MLQDLPFTVQELHFEIASRAGKMSIPGTQPKLSARLDLSGQRFEIVDLGGRFILKPQSPLAPHLPENEDLTMRLAAAAGLETPFHGLLFCKDGSLVYFVQRFDRHGRHGKVAMEDFAQLAGKTRFEKYDSTMEQVVTIIDTFCTFPLLEKLKLFRLTIFNLLVGNDDLHLKNLSLIRREGKVELTPVYDLVSNVLNAGSDERDLALPLDGKRGGLTRSAIVDHFGRDRLGLPQKIIQGILGEIGVASDAWERLIAASFLTDDMKVNYRSLLSRRRTRFDF
jgi:serine/threonine-protein kinase HipA